MFFTDNFWMISTQKSISMMALRSFDRFAIRFKQITKCGCLLNQGMGQGGVFSSLFVEEVLEFLLVSFV